MNIISAMEGMTFGCDPEVFVVDDKGEFVYPEFIPGTKDEPFKVEHGALQKDGMAAEFNIDPVTTYEEWDRNIDAVMNQMKDYLPSGYKLITVPTAVFSEEVWNNAPDEAKELGCSPDFNAWTGEVNPPPDGSKIPRLRTAAGHLHFGWTEGETPDNIQHLAACRDLIKQMDWYIGPWSVSLDKDKTRRSLYGRAGAMRYKPYGCEYRVPSNFWLQNKSRRKMLWNRMQRAIWDMRSGFIPTKAQKFGFNEVLIQNINESSISDSLKSKFYFPVKTISL